MTNLYFSHLGKYGTRFASFLTRAHQGQTLYTTAPWNVVENIAIIPLKTMFTNKQIQADEFIKFRDSPIKWENKIKLSTTI